MIKVNLGKKDKADRGPGSLAGGGGKGLGGIASDVKSGVILAVGAALGLAPYLFLSEFKGYLKKENAEKVLRVQENIALVDKEIERFNPFKKELESYESQKKVVKDRIEIVNALLAARQAPVNALDAIGQSLPHRTWLKEVTYENNNERPFIKMKGQALANEDVSDFIDKLSESIYFTQVDLTEVKTDKIGSTEVREFDVIADPKPAQMPESRQIANRDPKAAPPLKAPAPATAAAGEGAQ